MFNALLQLKAKAIKPFDKNIYLYTAMNIYLYTAEWNTYFARGYSYLQSYVLIINNLFNN